MSGSDRFLISHRFCTAGSLHWYIDLLPDGDHFQRLGYRNLGGE